MEGEWNQERFDNGNKWFFDKDTAINKWLPRNKDPRDIFYVMTIEVDPSVIYETHQHINNESVAKYMHIAQGAKKTIIGGIWDCEGSKQYYLTSEHEVIVVFGKVQLIPIFQLSNYLQQVQ